MQDSMNIFNEKKQQLIIYHSSLSNHSVEYINSRYDKSL